MVNFNRISITKTAAKSVVNSLTNADWVGFVDFNSYATQYSPRFMRATQANKDALNKYIGNL
jgi:hypothetical protein